MITETRYYIVDINMFRDQHAVEIDPYHADKAIKELPDNAFMTESENQGNVYTRESFIHDFNEGFIDSKLTYLRIIDIEGVCNGECTGCDSCIEKEKDFNGYD